MICLLVFIFKFLSQKLDSSREVPVGSPSGGGDVAVYVFDINRVCPPLFIPFLCLFLSIKFMALSTVFHSINSPDNSRFSHSVLPVLSLPYWPFQPHISLYESLPQP